MQKNYHPLRIIQHQFYIFDDLLLIFVKNKLKLLFVPLPKVETFESALKNESPKINIIPITEIDNIKNMNCSMTLSF